MSSKALVIAGKDLKVEARTRQSMGVIVLFTLMVVVAVGVTFASIDVKMTPEWASILVWVIILFAGSMALARSFSQETDRHTLEALLLCPMDRSDILMGKALSNMVFMVVVILETIVLFSAFLGWDLVAHMGPVLVVTLLGGIGLAALGTTLSGIAARVRAREIAVITMMIPLALFTLVIPGIQATHEILTKEVMFPQPLILILLFTLVYSIAGYLLSDYLLED